jgi:hypothetical protein
LLLEQDGREVTLRAGDMTMLDPSRAWVVAEIDNESERQTFDTSASVDVIWLNRRCGRQVPRTLC